MIRMASVLRFVAALALAALALPGLAAPAKIYGLNVSPVALPAGQTTLVTVIFKNEVPNGNSSFNSLTLTAPAGVSIPEQTITTPSGSATIVGNVIRVASISPVKPTKSFTFSFNVFVPATASCAFASWDTATTTFVYTGSNFSGDEFALQTALSSVAAAVGCDGILNCQNAGPPFSFGDTQASGYRSDNKDGSPCIPVAYDFTNDVAANNTINLKWDTAGQPNAAFSLTTTWLPEFVDPLTGLPTRTTKLAWQLDGFGQPIYVPGRACLSNTLPAPYTTLNGEITSLTTPTIVVNGGTPPAVPFAIVIGTERMQVDDVDGTTWTVQRGAGNTIPAAHPNGAKVMSTPLPLDGSGTQMAMCTWDEGWISVAPGTGNCQPLPTPPNPPKACVQYTTSVFDNGDGYVSRNQ